MTRTSTKHSKVKYKKKNHHKTKNNKMNHSLSNIEYVAKEDIKHLFDVVARRGAQNFHNLGHQRYLDERDKYHDDYVATNNRKLKQEYQEILIRWVENRGGRFLVPLEKQPGMYRTMTMKEKQAKVSQHLRERRKKVKDVPPTHSHSVPVNNPVSSDISASNVCDNGVIQGTMIQRTDSNEVNVDSPMNAMNDRLVLGPSLYQDDDMELLDGVEISMLSTGNYFSMLETHTTLNIVNVVLHDEDWNEICDAIFKITDDDIKQL